MKRTFVYGISRPSVVNHPINTGSVIFIDVDWPVSTIQHSTADARVNEIVHGCNCARESMPFNVSVTAVIRAGHRCSLCISEACMSAVQRDAVRTGWFDIQQSWAYRSRQNFPHLSSVIRDAAMDFYKLCIACS